MYLAIVKKFEPLLLLPIAFGMFLINLPGAYSVVWGTYPEGVEHTSKKMTSGKVGGKTGTAERDYKNAGGSCNKMNDVWYMCFLDDAQVSSKPVTGMQKDVRNSSLAVVVRIERLPSGNHSTYPKGFVRDRVLPVLAKLGYGNFD